MNKTADRPFLVTIKTPTGIKGERLVWAQSSFDAVEQVQDDIGPYCKVSAQLLKHVPEQWRMEL